MQASKIVEITKTYIPGDPNAFPQNIVFNAGEDQPAEVNPILAYEGWNFLPTSYGVKSYFGTNGELGIDALTSNVDWLLLYQKKTFENFLIVLADDGIWIKDSSVAGAWTQEITLALPPTGEHREWSWCVIGEDFYAYRQAGAAVYKISPYLGFWIDNDPIPNFIPVVDTVDVTGTIPVGTYQYHIAYKELVTGHVSIHGPAGLVGITVLGQSVDFTWLAPRSTIVDEYVFYRIDIATGIVEVQETNSTALTFTDTGAGWTVGTLPVAAAIKYQSYAVQSHIPNTLNMVGQLGIFKAGNRLGFWDSENAISWSALDNHMDFVPSLRTLAGGQKFDDVIGRIVTVKQSKESFVIYATKSIVFIQRNITEAFIWKSIVVTSKTGIAYSKEVALGTIDTEHFAWTSMGLLRIEGQNHEIILTSVADFLRESKDPVYPRILQNRYLFLNLLRADFIYGLISFTTEIVPALLVGFREATEAIEDPDAPGCEKYQIITKIPDQIAVYSMNSSGWDLIPKTSLGYPVGVDVPVYTGETNFYWPSLNSIGSNSAADRRIFAENGLESIISDFIDNNYTAEIGGTYGNITWNRGSLDMVYNFLIPTSLKEDYILGSLENFFPDQLQIWYGAIRVFQDYVSRLLAANVTLIQNTSVIEGVIDAAAQDAIFAGLNDLTNPAGIVSLGIIPVELGNEQIEAVDGGDLNPYKLISLYKPFTRLAFCYYRKNYVRTSTDILGGPSYEHFYTRTSTFNVTYITIDPCVGFTVESTDQDLIDYITTLLTPLNIEQKGWHSRMRVTSYIVYSLDGSSVASATPAGVELSYPATCPIDADNAMILGTIFGGFNEETGTICGDYPLIPGDIFSAGIVIPASSFLLQQGSPAPLYPTFEGSLVYDLHLKRWGKYRGQFKELLDYAPINNIAAGIVPYEVFGVEGAVLLTTGKIASFDEAPSDSYLKWGKIGYTRAGFTDAEEIIANFRRGSTGQLGVVGSIDGRSEDVSLQSETTFTNVKSITHPSSISAKWISITLKGLFDLQYLEFKGHRKSRR